MEKSSKKINRIINNVSKNIKNIMNNFNNPILKEVNDLISELNMSIDDLPKDEPIDKVLKDLKNLKISKNRNDKLDNLGI